MPVFYIKQLFMFVFLYFAISSTFHFYHLDTYLITNNNRKKIKKLNALYQFPAPNYC